MRLPVRPFARLFRLGLLLCALTLGLCPGQAHCAPANVGFMSLGVSYPERELKIDINVWYPTNSRRQRTFNFQSWSFRAANRAEVQPGLHPLILLSHPSAGSRFTHHDTASDLAARGFIVAVLTHPRDNLDHMPDHYSWSLFERRGRDLRVLVDILLADKHLGSSIDAGRIGMLGFGTGGTSALLAGGALPDCSLWKNYCASPSAQDPYCNAWAADAVNRRICPYLPLRSSLADTRIKACAVVEPSFAMLFSKDALTHYHPPTLLVFGDKEGIGSVGKERLLLPSRFPRPVETRYLAKADLDAFMAPCPQELLQDLPELCYSVDNPTRQKLHERLVALLADFYTRTLIRTVPRVMPDPPVFEMVGPPAP